VSGHISIPSLHFQRFDGLCPEGNIFRDGERPFLTELKGYAPLIPVANKGLCPDRGFGSPGIE